jgi:hypothetical protein
MVRREFPPRGWSAKTKRISRMNRLIRSNLCAMAACAVAVAFVAIPHSPGATVSDFEFTNTYTSDGEQLELRGVGQYKFKRLIKVNAAALYLPPDIDSSAVLNDVPKRLEIAYHRSIDAEDLVRSGDVYLQKNIPADVLANIQSGLEQMNAMYQNVERGDRYALTYVPGKGTTLSFNGSDVGTVPGEEFAGAYFTIWLGDEPVCPIMRNDLLSVDE